MFRGAEFLYTNFVRPVFLRNQPAIDAQFERLHGASSALRNVIGFDPLERISEGGGANAPAGAGGNGLPGGLSAEGGHSGMVEENGEGGPPPGIFGAGAPTSGTDSGGSKRRN